MHETSESRERKPNGVQGFLGAVSAYSGLMGKQKQGKTWVGIPKVFYITTPSPSQVSLYFPSQNLHAAVQLTRQEWGRFLAFLQAIRPFSSPGRRRRLACGFDFDTTGGIFILPSAEWWQQYNRRVAKLSDDLQKALMMETRSKKLLQDFRMERKAGLISRVYIRKGGATIYVPRHRFMKIRQACLNHRKDVVLLAKAKRAER